MIVESLMQRYLATLFIALASGSVQLHAAEPTWVSYGRAATTLTGTITEETFGEDASPRDRGARVWILHLDRPISVRAVPHDEIDVQELHVTEVHLSIDHGKHPIGKEQFGKVRFAVTGTLFHQFNTHHLRAIVMNGADLKPARGR